MTAPTPGGSWLTPQALQTLTVTGPDRRLAYRDVGAGPPVLLLMGLGADSTAWELHAASWSRRFRCLVLDNRGAGGSSSPPGVWSTADLADDCALLLDHLGVGPVAVVGVSMGGAVAQQLALRHPSHVSRLVLVASWVRCDAHTAEVLANLAAVRANVPGAVFTQLLQLWITSPSWFDGHLDRLHLDREAAAVMTHEDFAKQVAACITHDTATELASITIPTLVTLGRDDIFIRPALSTDLADTIRGAELIEFPGGHIHHWENLDPFNRKVAQWLHQ